MTLTANADADHADTLDEVLGGGSGGTLGIFGMEGVTSGLLAYRPRYICKEPLIGHFGIRGEDTAILDILYWPYADVVTMQLVDIKSPESFKEDRKKIAIARIHEEAEISIAPCCGCFVTLKLHLIPLDDALASNICHVCLSLLISLADENVPALALTRFDDQILPFAAWVPIGKSNFVLDLQKMQKNQIFQIFVDILQNTNLFRAFTASASVPAIYIQQFWNTLTYDAKNGAYSFQLDESRFLLDAYLPREALKIKPTDQAHQFVSPLLGDAIIDFVNELGYTEEIHFVSRMVVNNLYRPYRAILSMINQCLTGKTSGFDRPRYPVLQMLWANLSIAPQKGKKTKPHVIPYCQFTKLIICHLGRTYSLHQRSASPFHLAEKDLKLGNLKFVPKGEDDEPAKEKSSKLAPAPKPKVTKEKPSNPSHARHPKRDKVQKLRKGKTPLQLINEDEPTQPQPEPEPEHHGEGDEYDVERAIQMSLESFQAQSQAHVGGVAIREPVMRTPATEEASTGPFVQPQDNASANIVRDSSSPADAETCTDTDKINSGGDTEILDEFFAEKDKSRKRRRDDQDPPPPAPPLDLDPKAPSSSSKQQSGPYSEQPVKDVPIPDTAHISYSEDTDFAHLLKIKSRPKWLKPILEENRPATLEPDWVIPPNELPEPEYN
ncbi:hypothetical protein Tco_0260454 [Tanacetum coccineum]